MPLWPSNLPQRTPWWLSGKESACQCRRPGFDPWVGRFPGGGNGNPLWYSCLENPTDGGTCQATVRRVAKKLDMTWPLNGLPWWLSGRESACQFR